MSGNHGFPAEFHIRISGLVKGCKQWELCVYLYFGGTLPGHGERETLEVPLQKEVFQALCSIPRSSCSPGCRHRDRRGGFGRIRNTGQAGHGEAASSAPVPGMPADPRHDLLSSQIGIFSHLGEGKGEVEKHRGGIVAR